MTWQGWRELSHLCAKLRCSPGAQDRSQYRRTDTTRPGVPFDRAGQLRHVPGVILPGLRLAE
jgi:hypothetical protein